MMAGGFEDGLIDPLPFNGPGPAHINPAGVEELDGGDVQAAVAVVEHDLAVGVFDFTPGEFFHWIAAFGFIAGDVYFREIVAA